MLTKTPKRHRQKILGELPRLIINLNFQVPGADKERDPGQRLHEKPGNDADPRNRGLHVPCGICRWQPHHQRRRCGQHRVCYGR